MTDEFSSAFASGAARISAALTQTVRGGALARLAPAPAGSGDHVQPVRARAPERTTPPAAPSQSNAHPLRSPAQLAAQIARLAAYGSRNL
jgi:hypothetical protein